jgi:recombination protein RecT
MKPQIAKALPKHLSEDRMVRLLMTAVRNSPSLQQADPITILAASMGAAQMGLEPNTSLQHCFIVPYKRNGKTVAELQMGYKGYIQLAYNSGMYKAIYAHEVYPNDEFYYHYGLNKDLVHKPAPEPEGQPTFYYACYHLKNGGFDFKVMTTDQIKRHAGKFSKSLNSNNSPWKTNFDAMARKTVLNALLKYAPLSIEIQKALASDGTTKTDIAEDMADVIDVDYTEPQEPNNVVEFNQ